MTSTKAKSPKRAPRAARNLVGFFGHTWVPDRMFPDETRENHEIIEFQFKIIRELSGARYVVQLFSFMDGRPTKLAIYDETFLLGADVTLYQTEQIWLNEYEMFMECVRWERKAQRPHLLEAKQ